MKLEIDINILYKPDLQTFAVYQPNLGRKPTDEIDRQPASNQVPIKTLTDANVNFLGDANNINFLGDAKDFLGDANVNFLGDAKDETLLSMLAGRADQR